MNWYFLFREGSFYRTLAKSIRDLLGDERDFLANAANVAAVLYEELPEVNWAGFYLLKGQDLVLGPFQGKPACTPDRARQGRVRRGGAKSGKPWSWRTSRSSPGISPATRRRSRRSSCPMVRGGRLIGVLDLDSPILARFDDDDRAGLEEVARLLLEASDDEC